MCHGLQPGTSLLEGITISLEPIDFKSELESQLLNRRSDSHTELDTTAFRASSMGNCPRHILFSKLGVKRFDAQTQGKFQIGEFIHDYIQAKILSRHPTMHENEVTVDVDGLSLKGHYDCFDGSVVYDFKSQNGWWYYRNKYLPKEHHLDQLHVYMKALDVQHGLMVYINKADMEIETYPDYFGRDTHRWKNNDQKDQFEDGELAPGALTEDEHGTLIEFDPKRWQKIIDRAQQAYRFLEEHGFPESLDEIDAVFPNCGNSWCMGCKYEDGTEFDFSIIAGET